MNGESVKIDPSPASDGNSRHLEGLCEDSATRRYFLVGKCVRARLCLRGYLFGYFSYDLYMFVYKCMYLKEIGNYRKFPFYCATGKLDFLWIRI